MQREFLEGKSAELFDDVYSYIEEHNTPFGIKVIDIARALHTHSNVVRTICQVHEDLILIEKSRSDRAKVRKDG